MWYFFVTGTLTQRSLKKSNFAPNMINRYENVTASNNNNIKFQSYMTYLCQHIFLPYYWMVFYL